VIKTYLDDESEGISAALCSQNLNVDSSTRHLTDGILFNFCDLQV
jgi:hypothetical protein